MTTPETTYILSSESSAINHIEKAKSFKICNKDQIIDSLNLKVDLLTNSVTSLTELVKSLVLVVNNVQQNVINVQHTVDNIQHGVENVQHDVENVQHGLYICNQFDQQFQATNLQLLEGLQLWNAVDYALDEFNQTCHQSFFDNFQDHVEQIEVHIEQNEVHIDNIIQVEQIEAHVDNIIQVEQIEAHVDNIIQVEQIEAHVDNIIQIEQIEQIEHLPKDDSYQIEILVPINDIMISSFGNQWTSHQNLVDKALILSHIDTSIINTIRDELISDNCTIQKHISNENLTLYHVYSVFIDFYTTLYQFITKQSPISGVIDLFKLIDKKLFYTVSDKYPDGLSFFIVTNLKLLSDALIQFLLIDIKHLNMVIRFVPGDILNKVLPQLYLAFNQDDIDIFISNNSFVNKLLVKYPKLSIVHDSFSYNGKPLIFDGIPSIKISELSNSLYDSFIIIFDKMISLLNSTFDNKFGDFAITKNIMPQFIEPSLFSVLNNTHSAALLASLIQIHLVHLKKTWKLNKSFYIAYYFGNKSLKFKPSLVIKSSKDFDYKNGINDFTTGNFIDSY
jgi:hypothetical protein